MGVAITLKQYLTNHHINYLECMHTHTDSALASANAAHIASDHVAKSVLLSDGKNFLLAVLPADRRLEIDRLSELMDQDYKLATEDEISEVFDDCELGAIPPTGDAYGLKTIWDDSLGELDGVYMEAGDHKTLLRLKKKEFLRMMGESDHTTISHHIASV